eukprot:gene12538-6359_t
MKILAVGKGMGQSKKNYLKNNHTKENLLILDTPEPTDDFEGGLKTLENEIKQFKPDVVIGCSRGAKYVMELLCTNIYSGPTLLISAMTMSKQVPQCVPVIFAHGIKDVTIPIFTVEASASSGSKEICKVKQRDRRIRKINFGSF